MPRAKNAITVPDTMPNPMNSANTIARNCVRVTTLLMRYTNDRKYSTCRQNSQIARYNDSASAKETISANTR